jgi:hypothetical protein
VCGSSSESPLDSLTRAAVFSATDKVSRLVLFPIHINTFLPSSSTCFAREARETFSEFYVSASGVASDLQFADKSRRKAAGLWHDPKHENRSMVDGGRGEGNKFIFNMLAEF